MSLAEQSSNVVKFIRQFTNDIKLAMFSTFEKGAVYSLSATYEIDDNYNIWIVTGNDIATAEKEGTLLYTHNTHNTYLCIGGIIEEVCMAHSKLLPVKYKEWLSRKNMERSTTMIKMMIRNAAYWDNDMSRMVPLYPVLHH